MIRFTVTVQTLMPVHQTVEIFQSEQKSWTVQQTEQHATFTVAPLQPEAGSCLSRSPLSVRLFGSGTVSAKRGEGFLFFLQNMTKHIVFFLQMYN